MIDFRNIVKDTDRYNFHSHTQFCDGRANMEQFAAAAAEAGFMHYGFSPHSPIPFESPCNMSFDAVAIYLDEFARLKQKYAEQTALYAGMEIDYLGKEWGPANDYFANVPLDFSIGSVHFIPSGEGMVDVDGKFENFRMKMAKFFANDIRHVVETFYSQTHDMIDAGGFDIIGHYDKIGHNAAHFSPGIEETAWYKALVDDATDHIIAAGLTVEINTKARADHSRFFPAPRHWRRLAQSGATILVNSDAHYPELIDASRAEALQMLESCATKCDCHTA
ncbi:MAG: histidinol-phosphatase [Paramuribaculum sp.]|nr:histidinol-phosphatase [Paramuribaculum sp.]